MSNWGQLVSLEKYLVSYLCEQLSDCSIWRFLCRFHFGGQNLEKRQVSDYSFLHYLHLYKQLRDPNIRRL